MPTHRVSGKVTDSGTGAPLAGVQVYATDAAAGTLAGAATSDGAGDYTLDLNSAAAVYVWAATGQGYTSDARGPITPDPI